VFYFSRVVDSTDILKDAQEVELVVDKAGASSRARFTWSWDEESQARLRPPARRRGEEAPVGPGRFSGGDRVGARAAMGAVPSRPLDPRSDDAPRPADSE
jgi:hypothetical protein